MTDSLGEVRRDWDALAPAERRLCAILADADGPVGASRANHVLHHEGWVISQATVSRSLDKLDRLGITTKRGRSGRVLTGQGTSLVLYQRRRTRREHLLDGLAKLGDQQELIELLEVRKCVESQAAKLATTRATPADHKALFDAVTLYDEHTSSSGEYSQDAVQFHVAFCQATHSKPYEIIADALMPEMGRLEPLTAAAARAAGEPDLSQEQHRAILGAIISGDSDTCCTLVERHFDSMIAWLRNVDEDRLRNWIAELN